MSSYEYVIVGAGSAGCLLVGRLSAAGARVLLLEAGGSVRRPEVKVPAPFPNQFQTARDWNFMSEPEPALFGRRLSLPRGRMLGGSSSMNAMLYTRGNRADFDAWASEHDARGWDYAEVLPYFTRHEANVEIHDEFHGTTGELPVTQDRWLSPHWSKFIQAAEAIGIERNPDYNGALQEGASLFQTTTKGGRRWSAADAFLRPALKGKNLELASRALVHRIVIAGGRAVGVEYERGGARQVARAEREVVLSAGAYGSPQLLMLSGIGPADHLREFGIVLHVDSPQVGSHLQEHPAAFCNWHSNDPRTLDDASQPRHLVQWLATRKGKLSSTVAEAEIDAMLQALDLIEELAAKPPLAGVLGERLNPGGSVRRRQQRIEWLRATGEHLYHPVGSCRMGPPDDGVVDPELRVYGLEGLRVADASVMPRITSGNTNAPTYMIAERCAAIMLGHTQTTAVRSQSAPAVVRQS
jgi:choline dehydrogenase